MAGKAIGLTTPAAHGGVRPKDLSTRPVLDAAGVSGGDGGVTAFHDNGGRVLTQARIVLIYWGSAWTNPATTPSQSDFTNALTGTINGPWATQLAQYRGIGPLSIEQVATVTSTEPPATFTDPDIRNMIDAQINNGTLPAPSNSVDRIYAVLMPTGHGSGDTPYVGQHQFYDHSGARVYWAWVTNDGTLTGGNSIPKVFSHEIAEACSDPDLGSGILVDVGSDTNEEIGDVCNNTWATVNGAAEEAYWSEADNRCVIPQYQAFPAVSANPVLVQSRFGSKGNFELVVAAPSGGLLHFWRNNDNPFMPWSTATAFGGAVGVVDALSMIESNYGSPGNLEVIARVGDKLYHFWRDSGPAFQWNGPSLVASGATGNPVLIQSRFGSRGNFELVTPESHGLHHYWRNNDDPATPWISGGYFGTPFLVADAASMIESNYGSPGNLEVVARSGSSMVEFWRDSGPAFQWNGPTRIETGVAGIPALIQSRFGTQGNFELVTPGASGGLVHFWRDNDAPGTPWNSGGAFGASLGAVAAVTLIQSNYGSPGNLEVIALAGSDLYYFWRDSGPAFNWNGPYLLRSTVW
jgi:hypothetical protein